MTAEERIAQLEQENAQLRAELAEARQQIAHLAERLHQVEGRLAKDSQNSSKPPSSDGPARRSRSQRKASGKKTGGTFPTRVTLDAPSGSPSVSGLVTSKLARASACRFCVCMAMLLIKKIGRP